MDKKQEENIDFMNLILMLNQNALTSLGEAPRFIGGMKKENLPLARQTINMIKAISDKTRGNLNPAESKLIFRILGDLQKKYVIASGLMKPETPDEKKAQAVKAVSEKHADNLDAALDKLKDSELAAMLEELKKNAK